ncbi:hypothetical protein BDN71DRAFT_1458877, partial [Pleurotus eryngii]
VGSPRPRQPYPYQLSHAWVITGSDFWVGSSRDGGPPWRDPTEGQIDVPGLLTCTLGSYSPRRCRLWRLGGPSTVDTPSRDENRPYRISVEADLEGMSCGHRTLGAAHTIGHRRTRTPKALAAPPKEQHHNPADWPGVTDDEKTKGLSGRANGARGQISL